MKPGSYRNAVLFVLCLSAFLVPFIGSALNLALPKIGAHYKVSVITLGWVVSSYLITTAIFQVPCARLADMVGRRKIFIWGVLIFTIFTLLSGFAPTITWLIVFRVLSGIGSAMMFGTNMAILTSVIPPNERGRALGINTAIVYFSLASGPFFGGILTQHLGWQSIFFVCAAIGLIVVICTLLILKGEWIEAKNESFDWVGSIIYAVGLFGLIYGFSNLTHLWGIGFVIVGIAAFILFVYYEKHCKYPVFNVNLFFGNKVFSLSTLAALINYSATTATGFMMSLYLQDVRGYETQAAGMILIVQSILQAIVSLMAGRLSDRIEPSRLATLGMAIIVVGLVCLSFINIATPIGYIVGVLMLMGVGFGIFSSPNVNVIMGSVDKKYYGQASATTGTVRLTGQSFSLGIAMMAISLFIGKGKIEPETYSLFMSSLRVTFIICAVLCAVGVYASMARNKRVVQ